MNIELSEQEVLRRQSLKAMRDLGINPYPAARYEVNATAREIAEQFDPEKVDVHFTSAAGDIAVCEKGRGLNFDEDLAKKILTEHDVEINITMGEGEGVCTCWGCDITYDYIKINGDYRT